MCCCCRSCCCCRAICVERESKGEKRGKQAGKPRGFRVRATCRGRTDESVTLLIPLREIVSLNSSRGYTFTVHCSQGCRVLCSRALSGGDEGIQTYNLSATTSTPIRNVTHRGAKSLVLSVAQRTLSFFRDRTDKFRPESFENSGASRAVTLLTAAGGPSRHAHFIERDNLVLSVI